MTPEDRIQAFELQLARFEEREALEDRITRLEERRVADTEARGLQAVEYERRLTALNHAHEKALEVQHTYVTQDKYEDKLNAEEEARTTALLRVDEKFDSALTRVDEKFQDHVKRWELRQREIDMALDTQKGAALEATRQVEDQARKTNRNLAIAVIVISVIVGVVNYLAA